MKNLCDASDLFGLRHAMLNSNNKSTYRHRRQRKHCSGSNVHWPNTVCHSIVLPRYQFRFLGWTFHSVGQSRDKIIDWISTGICVLCACSACALACACVCKYFIRNSIDDGNSTISKSVIEWQNERVERRSGGLLFDRDFPDAPTRHHIAAVTSWYSKWPALINRFRLVRRAAQMGANERRVEIRHRLKCHARARELIRAYRLVFILCSVRVMTDRNKDEWNPREKSDDENGRVRDGFDGDVATNRARGVRCHFLIYKIS